MGSTPVKNVTVKKGSYGDRSYTANWRIYPAQKYVIAKIKDHLKYNYSGTLVSSGYPVYDYNSDSGNLVRFIDEGKAGEIAIACFHYNGNRITAVIMYLTETGTKFDYIYSDYIEDGYNYLNAEGYTYADRFFFQEESGLDFGDDEAFEEHKSKAGSCLWDIVAVLDMFCEEFVPGYGAGSFGLYN